MTLLNLEERCGLPVRVDLDTCDFVFRQEVNQPSFRTRMLHDLDLVWALPVEDADKIIYRYTSGIWFHEDEPVWKNANIIYGLVVFAPGIFAGEYNKSSGQYHPIIYPNKQATPEIYTVLYGTGHFLLQRSSPPYETIEDAVMVHVEEGYSFVVPPDYGHLQINPLDQPLIFSYTVMSDMNGVYEPFQNRRGAIYYEMSDGTLKFNNNYPERVPLRKVNAAGLKQLPLMDRKLTYHDIMNNIDKLEFLTNPSKFPEQAKL